MDTLFPDFQLLCIYDERVTASRTGVLFLDFQLLCICVESFENIKDRQGVLFLDFQLL
jgi:hypothetical protein